MSRRPRDARAAWKEGVSGMRGEDVRINLPIGHRAARVVRSSAWPVRWLHRRFGAPASPVAPPSSVESASPGSARGTTGPGDGATTGRELGRPLPPSLGGIQARRAPSSGALRARRRGCSPCGHGAESFHVAARLQGAPAAGRRTSGTAASVQGRTIERAGVAAVQDVVVLCGATNARSHSCNQLGAVASVALKEEMWV